MANYTYASLKDEYKELWGGMIISPSRVAGIKSTANKIIKNKEAYLSLQRQTNVPWYFIGLLHLRESNCDFNTHLHNGDPLSARTVHVPAGRPLTGTAPFSFEYSAIDAIKQKSYDKITDWSIERMAYCFEKYNGFGYRGKRINSPYLWASSNQYTRGKYIRDGVFSAATIDTQLGVMLVLKVILDQTNSEILKQIETPTISPTTKGPRPTNQEMSNTSRKFKITDWLRWLLGIGGGGAATVETLNSTNITATRTYVETIKSFTNDYGLVLVVIICLAAFVAIMLLRKYMKDDVQEGRATPSGQREEK